MNKNSKKNILDRLQKAVENKTEVPYPELLDSDGIFNERSTDLLNMFANEFQALSGKYFFCKNHDELILAIEQSVPQSSNVDFFCADALLIHLLKNAGFKWPLNAGNTMGDGSVSLSSCMKLVARTGSILFSSVQAEGRSYAIAPDTQIVIASKNQLVYNISEAIEAHVRQFTPMPSMISLTSGASRTADIEKTLVMGAHGPKELILILMDY